MLLRRIVFLSLCCVMACSFVGCGSNPFEQADKLVTADNASTPEEWAKVIKGLEEIIANADGKFTAPQVKQAQIDKATSLLAKNELGALDIVSNISKVSETTTSNIFNLVSSSGNKDDIDSSAKLLNDLKGDLTEAEQVTRGMANTFAVTQRVNDAFDVSADGTVKAKSTSNFDSFDALMTPSSAANGSKTIVDFSNDAKESFTSAGVLSNDQSDEVDKVLGASTQLTTLQDKVNNGGTFVTSKGESIVFLKDDKTNKTSSGEDKLNKALESIFGG